MYWLQKKKKENWQTDTVITDQDPPHPKYKKKKGKKGGVGGEFHSWDGLHMLAVGCSASSVSTHTQLQTDPGWEDRSAVPSCWWWQGRWRTPLGRRGEAAAAASARPEAGAAYRPAWSCPRQHLRTKHRADADVMHCSTVSLRSSIPTPNVAKLLPQTAVTQWGQCSWSFRSTAQGQLGN